MTKKKSKIQLAELYREGVSTGRPPKYKTPEALSEKIQEYFDEVDSSNTVPTISGLSLFCGFSSRQSFYDYEGEKKKGDEKNPQKTAFSYITRGARSVIANFHEIQVSTKDKPQGHIFMLKNFGFSDSQTIKHEGEAPVQQTFKIGKTVVTW